MTTQQPTPDVGLGRAARGGALSLVGALTGAVATFGLTVIVTRLTSSQDAGIFFSATSLFLVATGLVVLGANTGLVYFLSAASARNTLEYARAWIRVALRPVLLITPLVSVALVLWAEPLGRTLSPGAPEDFARILRVLAFFLPAAALLNLLTAATRGLASMRATVLLDQIVRPIAQLALVFAALTIFGDTAGAWAWASAYLPLAIVAWWMWSSLLRARTRRIRPSRRPGMGREFWSFSWPRALAGVAQVAMQRFDIVLVGALAGLTEAAIYTAATRFVSLGQMVNRAVFLSTQPQLGRRFAVDDIDGARVLYQTSTSWLVLLVWPLYLTLLSFSGLLLSVFGSEYPAGTDALRLLAVAMLVASGCGIVDVVVLMAGRSFWNMANVLIAFAVNLAVDLVLIEPLGVMGAAIGWGAALLVGNLLPLGQVMHWFGFHPFGRQTLLAMAVTGLSFGLVPALAAVAWGQTVLALIVALIAGLVAHAGSLYLWRDRFGLDELVAAVRGRQAAGQNATGVRARTADSKER